MTTITIRGNRRAPLRVLWIREGLWQSILSDVSTIAMFLGMGLIGVWLDSEPLQWVGAVLAMVALVSSAKGHGREMTLGEVRTALDELERDERDNEAR